MLIVYLKKQYLLEGNWEEIKRDMFGFEVLATTPDPDETIPCRRLSDKQYCCLPIYAIQEDPVDIVEDIANLLFIKE
jgi:hypothetical protein